MKFTTLTSTLVLGLMLAGFDANAMDTIDPDDLEAANKAIASQPKVDEGQDDFSLKALNLNLGPQYVIENSKLDDAERFAMELLEKVKLQRQANTPVTPTAEPSPPEAKKSWSLWTLVFGSSEKPEETADATLMNTDVAESLSKSMMSHPDLAVQLMAANDNQDKEGVQKIVQQLKDAPDAQAPTSMTEKEKEAVSWFAGWFTSTKKPEEKGTTSPVAVVTSDEKEPKEATDSSTTPITATSDEKTPEEKTEASSDAYLGGRLNPLNWFGSAKPTVDEKISDLVIEPTKALLSTKNTEAAVVTTDTTATITTGEIPVVTAEETPVETADEAPEATADEAPEATADEAPVVTTEETPVVTDEAPVVTTETSTQ